MKNELYHPHKSSISSLDANLVALLSYIISIVVSWIPVVRYGAWLAPLVAFFMEKQSGFVKFHAMQSFVLQAFGAVLSFLLTVVVGGVIGIGSTNVYTAYAAFGISGIVGLLTLVLSIAILVFAILAMFGAWKYKEYHIPVAGGIAEKVAAKFQGK